MKIQHLLLVIGIFLFSFTFISAQGVPLPQSSTTNFYTGNLTNLSEMQDVSADSPTNGQFLRWVAGTGKWTKYTFDLTDFWDYDYDDLINKPTFGNPFDQDLNTTDSPTFENLTVTGYFLGDGSQLTGIVASANNYSILVSVDNITDFPTTLSYFTDDLGDRGYTSLSNFTNDYGYYNSTTIPSYLTEETNWNANYSDFLTISAWNDSGLIQDWNASGLIINWSGDYATLSEILAFNYYNSTDFDIADYFTKTEVLGFGYYNSTDFDISNYYTKTEINNFDYYNNTNFPYTHLTNFTNDLDFVELSTLLAFNYYNSTNAPIYLNDTFAGNYSDYLTKIGWAEVTNGTLYLSSNPSGYITWAEATNGTLALTSAIPTDNSQLANGNNYYNSTTLDLSGYFNSIENFTGTLTDTKYCTYDSASGKIVCNSEGGSGGGSGTLTGAGTYGYIPMWNGTTSLNNSVIYQNGSNVGIGTINPSQDFHLTSSSNTGFLYETTSNSSWAAFFGYNDLGGGNEITAINYGSAKSGTLFGLSQANLGAFYKRGNGNLIIGTGAFAGSGELLFGTNNTERMRITSSGNVGIGTIVPNSTLHVIGDINVTGDIAYGTLTANSPVLFWTEDPYNVFIKKASNGNWYVEYVDDKLNEVREWVDCNSTVWHQEYACEKLMKKQFYETLSEEDKTYTIEVESIDESTGEIIVFNQTKKLIQTDIKYDKHKKEVFVDVVSLDESKEDSWLDKVVDFFTGGSK